MYKKIILSLLINSFIFSQAVFFSEYAEGSSNHKYLEIYNNTDQTIDLSQYAFPNSNNGASVDGEYDYWNVFDGLNQNDSAPVSGNTLVDSGEVYVVCHNSSDDLILADCDQYHTYLSNGDDGFCLVFGNESDFTVLDCIGNWSSTDPGSGWDVAGVNDGTKDHTLVRKMEVVYGNEGNWNSSAGTTSENSEWVVLEQNDWTYLGFHPHDINGGSSDDGGSTGGGDAEICDNEIDDDGDGYIDCNDFDCPPCEGGEGSCAEYGCVDYTPSNACQCNDLCADFGNCCDDYEELCAGEDSGGSTGGGNVEICDDGIDNDGDSYIDCEDYNCNGTIGDIDPACEGSDDGGSTGGGSGENDCTNGIDDDGDGYVDCNDFDCDGDPACPDEICDNGIDDDGNGFIDCDDWACSGGPDGEGYIDPSCEGSGTGGGSGENDCTNGVDDDGDGYVDCNDFDCNGDPACPDEICDNGIDDDGNGFIDCNDWACNGGPDGDWYIDPACEGSSTGGGFGDEICDDCIDNDGDSYIDCDDFDCEGNPACPDEICDNGIDDDENGYIDCNDFACSEDPACPEPEVEICNDGIDNDGDTYIDCEDWSCNGEGPDGGDVDPACVTAGCTDESAFNYDPDVDVENNDLCLYSSFVTIQEIQGESDSSPYEDMAVVTQGLVTAVNSDGFYMQDDSDSGPWSGIWVYNDDLDLEVQEGMLVEVEGLVLEFYGLTEILLDKPEYFNSLNEEPTSFNSYLATTGELNNESFESVYVQISAECTALENESGDWILNDGSGNILVGDNFIDFNPDLGTSYNVIGILDYEFNEYKIQPITIEVDYQEGDPIASAGEDQFVEEGVQVTLDGTGSIDLDGSIIGYEWSQTSGVAVDLGNYENNIVTFTAPNYFAILEFSLTVLDNDFNYSYSDYITVTVGTQGIYDVQYTESIGEGEECYPSDLLGSTINITGIVTAVKTFSSYPHFFIQDPDFLEWGGIYVYVDESEPFNIGDELNFSAEVDEYYGVTELKNLENVQLLSSNNEINPVSISTGSLGLECGDGEKYEGMFVEFSNVVVDSIDVQYNSVYINDNSGMTKLDDYYYNFDLDGDGSNDYWPDLSVGDTLETAIGVVHYYFGEYVVYPRSITDLAGIISGEDDDCVGSDDGGNTGGGSGDEICDDGIDNDGDSYIDCEDYNCNGTIGDIDPACEGSDDGGSTGGGSGDEICNDGIDNDGDSYIDCDDWSCNGEGPDGGDVDPACEGSDDGGSNGECDDSNFADLFFSEYAEGSSNNKYLEIYNNSDEAINLCGYAFPNSTNGADIDGTYDYWNTFDDNASVAAGEVYVICHGASDEIIQLECDQSHTYLSNGDDGFCLTFGNENNFQILDCIGDWSSTDPGYGWEVAGVEDGTKDHTLVRKSFVSSGNQGDWTSSAGTTVDDSEWIVLEQNNWTYLGFHDIDNSGSDGGGECIATGDINDDGNINVVDVVQIVNNVLNLIEFNDDQFCAADLNSDDTINVVDVVQLVNIILGIN